MASRRIDIPPSVAGAIFEGLNFVGRHVANGVKASKASMYREAARGLRQKADELERLAFEEEGGTVAPTVLDAEFVEPVKGGTRGRRR